MGALTLPVVCRFGVAVPSYATDGAAGLDLASTDYAELDFGDRAVIGTGVSVAIPDGYVGLLTIRSSLGAAGVIIPNAPGVIDPDYRGEVLVPLLSLAGERVAIREGHRVAQLVVVPAPRPAVAAVASLPPTARGGGGFGSTGR